jgi:hypothetical protein
LYTGNYEQPEHALFGGFQLSLSHTSRAVFRRKRIIAGRTSIAWPKTMTRGEGAGGGCAPSCVEREAETTYKVNGKLKRGPLQHY